MHGRERSHLDEWASLLGERVPDEAAGSDDPGRTDDSLPERGRNN